MAGLCQKVSGAPGQPMSKRSERLLLLVQALRHRRRPVTGQVLADEMGISLRSLYRDIETLKSL
ncbi:HTH domain-containing protein, partial [Enterococcus faecium]|uniref:HTH domain-containing protein n=1 Tax=Enterococcus faecium TaxID=1352 RepID=UPI003F525D54